MNTRTDERGETLYGDAPLIDHDGYAVEVIAEPGDHHMHLRVATEPAGGVKLRADLTPPQVRELRDRCDAYLNDHQEKP
ncbi:hypothetical protein [Nocardia ignorata]|uniref:Uncharacterized protein n=1 Tax=Nocardia ignorata TaxID=145285 RepID=A0A4R6NYX8_NOCIG|nr:hypothetical protein [Nocardia ignorata]TDP29829.1 hypothetical protein DFR75_11297 [Nocardia ignorata]